MAQAYYRLQEAAQLLGISEDDLKMKARRGEIRSFQDRGTWRFRVQDIQDLARKGGAGSEPDLELGESLKPVPKSKADAQTGADEAAESPKLSPDQEGFDHSQEGADDSSVGIGQEPLSGPGSSKKSSSQVDLGGPRTPEPGSDSDVRLVSDDSNVDFGIEIDSDPRLDKGAASEKSGSSKRSGAGKSDSGKAAKVDSDKQKADLDPSPPDSGVRLVPIDSDSDVRIVGSDDSSDEYIPLGDESPKSKSDSDIRLESDSKEGSDSSSGRLTDEIDLDAELQRQQEQGGQSSGTPLLPSESPFELSETDFHLPSTGSSLQPGEADTGSSDVELTPGGEAPSDSGEVDFGESLAEAAEPGSGITLDSPVDSGISLEQESEGSDEFKLGGKTSSGPKTPPPSQGGQDSSSDFELSVAEEDSSSDEMLAIDEPSSSEFELTLDADDSSEESPVMTDSSPTDSSSEFELTLDADDSSSEFELTIDADHESSPPDLGSDSEFELQLDDSLDSSSEFELTIDDDVQLAPEDEGVQTDLDEVPLMEDEDESSSEVLALEEEPYLEDSDFDIDLEEESGSQVVALEEDEDLIEAGAAVADKGEFGDFEAGEDYGDFVEQYDEFGEPVVAEREVEREPVVVERDVYAAPWPAWPVVVMMPCVVIMFLVGIMGFELLQSMSGYREPGMITKAIAGLMGINIGS